MRTIKQARSKYLNKNATQWNEMLTKYGNRDGQAEFSLEKINTALTELGIEKLTVKQIMAITTLLGRVGSDAFSNGVELGKSFNQEKKGA